MPDTSRLAVFLSVYDSSSLFFIKHGVAFIKHDRFSLVLSDSSNSMFEPELSSSIIIGSILISLGLNVNLGFTIDSLFSYWLLVSRNESLGSLGALMP